MILANCSLSGCPPVPAWVAWPLAIIGIVGIVITVANWRDR